MLPLLPSNRSRAASSSHSRCDPLSLYCNSTPIHLHSKVACTRTSRTRPNQAALSNLSSVLPRVFAIATASRVVGGTASCVLRYRYCIPRSWRDCAPRSQRSGRISGANLQFPHRLTHTLKWGTILETLPRGTWTHGRYLAHQKPRCSSYLAERTARCSSYLHCRD
jgi:hypothetical protein